MIRLSIATITLALVATQAKADPCTAKVTGYRPGDRISGLVWHSIDGDGLCVGASPTPSTWIEIREADFYAPELRTPSGRDAKRVMDQLVGKRAVCSVQLGQNGRTANFDRVIAACRIDGASIATIMRRAGVREGGRGR